MDVRMLICGISSVWQSLWNFLVIYVNCKRQMFLHPKPSGNEQSIEDSHIHIHPAKVCGKDYRCQDMQLVSNPTTFITRRA